MNHPAHHHLPVGLFGVDDAIVIAVLAVIIAIALISIALDLKKMRDDTKRAEALRAQQKALDELKALVDALKEAGSANAEQCAEMRRLYDVAVSAGVNQFVLKSIKTQIDKLCPG